MRYNDTNNNFSNKGGIVMAKKILHVLYWVVIYVLSFTGGYLLGRAAQKLEEKVGLVER